MFKESSKKSKVNSSKETAKAVQEIESYFQEIFKILSTRKRSVNLQHLDMAARIFRTSGNLRIYRII